MKSQHIVLSASGLSEVPGVISSFFENVKLLAKISFLLAGVSMVAANVIVADSLNSGGASYNSYYANRGAIEPVVGVSSYTSPDGPTIRAFHGFIGQLENPIFAVGDLALTVSGPTDAQLVGDTFTVTVTVVNRGPERAENTRVTLNFSGNISFSGQSGAISSVPTASGIDLLLGPVSVGQTITLTISAKAASKGSATCLASVFGDIADADPANNSATISLPVLGVSRWSGAISGDWFTSGNWLSGQVPGESDFALIEISGSSIRADGPVTVGGLKHSGFRLLGSGPINILHRGEFTRGLIAINLHFAPTAIVTLTGPENIYFGNLIENEGLFIWQGTGGYQFGGGVLNNRPGAVFDIQTDSPIYSPSGAGLPPSAINNFGLIRKSAGTGETPIGGPASVPLRLHNSARVEVLTGSLNIASGGTSTGEFFTQAGATIEFSNANETFTFNNGSQFTGAGAWRGTSASLVMNGEINSGGFELVAGRLSGNFTLRGSMAFTDGRVVQANMTIPVGSELHLAGPAPKWLQDSTVNNDGSLIFEGDGPLVPRQTAINNNSSGIFDIRSDSPIYSPQGEGLGPSSINNMGLFRKSGSPGQSSIGGLDSAHVLFNNVGRLHVKSGLVSLGSGGVATGIFLSEAGTKILFPNGVYTFNNGASFTGPGVTQGTGASLVMNGEINSTGFELVGGRLGGTFTLRGSMAFTDGRVVQANMTIPVGSELHMAGPAPKWLQDSTVNNNGSLIFEGDGPLVLRQTAINNDSSGIFDIRSDSPIYSPQGEGLGPSSINNTGLFQKSGSSGQSSIGGLDSAHVLFNNVGRLHVKSGSVSLGSGGVATGIFRSEAGTKILFPNGVYTFNNGASFSGPGVTQGTGALITMNGAIQSDGFELLSGELNGDFTLNGKFIWLGGTVAKTPGKMTVGNGAIVAIAGAENKVLGYGGQIDNFGTILWSGDGAFVAIAPTLNNRVGALFEIRSDAPLVNPQGSGFPPGVFNNFGLVRKASGFGVSKIGGTDSVPIAFNNDGVVEIRSGGLSLSSYNASAAASLEISLGGQTPLTQFGQLQVLGSASLNGTIAAVLAPGYTPAPGHTFQVLTASPPNGAFSQILTKPENSPILFTPIYQSTAVLLSASASRPVLGLANLGYNNGTFHLNLSGSIGHTYILQATTDFTTWDPIATNILEQSLWQFDDPSGGPYRYYRALLK